MPDSNSGSKPRFPIRRFDVFAEYNRVKNVADGMTKSVAKGRGLWIAKVVASRRGGSTPKTDSANKHGQNEQGPEEHDDGFRSIGGAEQTDDMFDHEIVDRMGKEFYQQVFQPAIEAAFKEGRQYTEIRDSIRKNWK